MRRTASLKAVMEAECVKEGGREGGREGREGGKERKSSSLKRGTQHLRLR